MHSLKSLEGVKDVHSHLQDTNSTAVLANDTMPSNLSASDQVIYKNVKDTVSPGIILNGYPNVTFSVLNGVVSLGGSVESLNEKVKVQDAIKKIKGVTDVNNAIKIVSKPSTSKTALADDAVINNLSSSDQVVYKKVKDAIAPGLISRGYPNVSFTVDNGGVTLIGSVDKIDDKAKLQETVSKIDGVKQVYNNVQVGTNAVVTDNGIVDVSASDQAIYKKIKDMTSPGLLSKGYPDVTFTVVNGVVTLVGSVEKVDDNTKLQDSVKKIDGVKQVNANLQVVAKTAYTDDTSNMIASDQVVYKKVKDAISPGYISKGYPNVGVTIANGVVTLTGFVDKLDDKAKLLDTVKKVSGVRQVNNNVQVGAAAAVIDGSVVNTLSAPDQAIYKKVSDTVSPGMISSGYPRVTFTVSGGVVNLSGSVDNLNEKTKLKDSIKKIDGVREVNETLQISPRTAMNDDRATVSSANVNDQAAQAATSADVKLNKKIQDKLGFKYNKLMITSSKGVVTVSGDVRTISEVTKIQNDIKSVRGVTRVINELTVN